MSGLSELSLVNPSNPDWYTADHPPSDCFRDDQYYFYQRYDEDSAFCEGRHTAHQPWSCITDVWMLGMAFWQMTWDHDFAMMRFSSACIAVNSVGSFFNHFLGTRQWMIMDNSSMYIELWIVATVVMETMYRNQRWLFNKRTHVLNRNQVDCGRPLIKSGLWTLCAFAIFGLLMRDIAGCEKDPNDLVFIIVGVAIPLLALLYNWYLVGCRAHKKDKEDSIIHRHGAGYLTKRLAELNWEDDTLERSNRYMRRGVGLALFFAIVWVVTENVCKASWGSWVVYIGGHGWWHIFMSYGLSLMAIWIVAIDSMLEERYFGFKSIEVRRIACRCNTPLSDKWNTFLQRAFPIITNNKNYREPGEFNAVAFCLFCCCSKEPSMEDALSENISPTSDEEKGKEVALEVNGTGQTDAMP